MHGKGLLLGKLILLIALFFPVVGCWPPGEIKFVNNRWVLCPEETLIGERFRWGTRAFQNAVIEPGRFRFKFDVTPVNSSRLPPTEYRLDFFYRRKRQILFSENVNIFTRTDGSIPYQSFNFLGFDVRKNDRAIFDLYPLDRNLPESNVRLRFQYNLFKKSSLSSLGISLPVNPSHLFELEETEYLRQMK